MLIDCDSCTAGPRACGDCIVTHLLQVGPARGRSGDRGSGPGPAPWEGAHATQDGSGTSDVRPGGDRAAELTESEVAAVAVLSAGGLVPPLRLVTPTRPAAPAPVLPPAGTAGRAGRRGGRSRAG